MSRAAIGYVRPDEVHRMRCFPRVVHWIGDLEKRDEYGSQTVAIDSFVRFRCPELQHVLAPLLYFDTYDTLDIVPCLRTQACYTLSWGQSNDMEFLVDDIQRMLVHPQSQMKSEDVLQWLYVGGCTSRVST